MTPTEQETRTAAPETLELALDRIRPSPLNPRSSFEFGQLHELAATLTTTGLIQPILVRALSDGFYEIIAGERRWRAAQLAKLDRIPAIVRQADDVEAMELRLIENREREDLNAVEEAVGFRAYLEATGKSQQELADRLGVTQPTISAALRLLELPKPAQELLAGGNLSAAHGRELLRLKDHPKELDATVRILRADLKAGDPTSTRRLGAIVGSKIETIRWRAEEAKRRKENKAAAAKATIGAKDIAARERTAKRKAEAKDAAERAEIAAQAETWAGMVRDLLAAIRLPDQVALAVVRTLYELDPFVWGMKGLAALDLSTLDRIVTAILPHLPGRWKLPKGGAVVVGCDVAKDATAVRSYLAVLGWVHGLDGRFLKTFNRRIEKRAAELLEAAAPKPVKKGRRPKGGRKE